MRCKRVPAKETRSASPILIHMLSRSAERRDMWVYSEAFTLLTKADDSKTRLVQVRKQINKDSSYVGEIPMQGQEII